jgi:two-component system CitB family sensor kinase
MLHAIREGVITLNADKKITLINDEAIRLLELSNSVIGKRISDVIPEGRLRALLEGDIDEDDDLRVLTDTFSILINRRVVMEKHLVLGSVITLRDRTEHIGLLRELESVQNFTEALRSQQHEFANRLHTINGLLELKKYDEASEFLGEIALVQTSLAEDLGIKLGNSLITALLIAKVAIARERGVTLNIEVAAPIDNIAIDQNALVTVVGNLIDNGIDAAAGSPKAEVTVVFSNTGEGGKFIRVHDSGPGLPESDPTIVFEDGYSTKSTRGAGHRGLGLAIVQRLVRQAAGSITAQNENGATFIVELPSIPANVLRGSNS